MTSSAASPQKFFMVRQTFSRSIAAASICQYVGGIGDRHLKNILLHEASGEAVFIDFGHAFGSAMQRLQVPELMPFRMTKQMISALAPLDAEGLLHYSMVRTLAGPPFLAPFAHVASSEKVPLIALSSSRCLRQRPSHV